MTSAAESRTESLLSQMTVKEKCALLSGLDSWRTFPIPRLGIESITMTDGPHGVRATEEIGRFYEPATSFPTGISMAATWNPALIERVGAALAEETRALGCHVLLGPCANIVRHPTAGRNFESYSEDPYLAGRIGIGWVKGIQGKGVGASLKHFACNNQETERHRGSSEIDERTLREIYLAQFEAVVKEARPWTVMCSYNRINGVYASQNDYLLNQILKGEWAWDGAVVSDWGANHTVFESVQGGLDLEMPGPAKYYGRLLEEAVRTWQIEEASVDEAVRRVLRLIDRASQSADPGSLNTPAHQALARQVAEESITLLQNERSILPLDPARLKSIAVVGPMAVVGSIGGGGSSYVIPPYRVSPLDGLRARLDDQLEMAYEPGCDNYDLTNLPVLDTEFLRPSRGAGAGLYGEYFASADFSGEPVMERVDPRVDFWWLNFAPNPTPRPYSVRWTGQLIAPHSGNHILRVQNLGVFRLFLNGDLLLQNSPPQTSAEWPMPQAEVELSLEQGRAYDLRIEFIRPDFLDFPHVRLLMGYTPRPGEDDRLERAVALAQQSDVALVFVGWPEAYESEGWDRPGIGLTGRQDDLIRAVAAANPNTVVVLNCGSPVAMPWAEQVAAIVEAFYPGQEGGHAVASILLGEVNPSGKLPVTFPQRLEDTPAFTNFGGGKKVYYGEGIFVGYRHYDARDIEPLFPFGHGLSYTTFEYGGLNVPARAAIGEPVTVSFTVANTGDHPGAEIVQVYVRDVASSLPRPPKELKGFAKVVLNPGERQTVALTLDERAFAFYDPDRHAWVVEPGEFEILIGASSRDIRLAAAAVLERS